MFCKNCGNEIGDNVRFCSKCGTQIGKPTAENTQPQVIEPEVAEEVIAPQVEEPQQQEPRTEVTQAEAKEPQAEPQTVNDAAGQNASDAIAVQTQEPAMVIQSESGNDGLIVDISKKPKKGKFAKILIAVVLVLALAVTSFAHPVLRNSVMRTFMSEDAYFEHVMVNCAEELAKSLADSIAELKDMASGDIEASGTVEFELGAGAKDLMYEYASYSAYEAVEWFDTAAVEFDAGKSGDVHGMNLQYKINDTDIVSVNLAMEGSKVYYSVPELSDEAICIDFAEVFESAGVSFGFSEIISSFNEIMEIIPDEDVLEDILVRYITCMAKSIEGVEEEKTTVEAGGVEQSAVSMTFTVDEDLLAGVLDAVLGEMANDKDIEKIIRNVAELDMVGMDGGDAYDEFITEIEEIQSDLEDDINLGNAEFDLTFVANNRGELIGASIEADGGQIEFYSVQDGSKYGQLVKIVTPQGQDFEIQGSGTVNGGRYTGEIELGVMGMQVLTMELEGVDKSLMDDGIFSGRCTVSASENIGSLLSMSGNSDIASIISGFKIEIDSESTKTKSDAELSIYMGEAMLGAIKVSATDSTNADFEIPADYVNATDSYAMQSWVESMGTNIYEILGRLQSAGMPSMGY